MLIATDLDGTLLPDGAAEPSARSAAALRRADAAGIPVVFVTGRPPRWMARLWAYAGAHGQAIVSNGAAVFDTATGEPIRVEGIAPQVGLEVADAIRSRVPGSAFAIEAVDGIRVEPTFGNPHDLPAGSPVGPLADVWTSAALKLLVRAPAADREQADALHRTVVEVVGARATCTWSMPGLVEISAAGVTKASALAWVAEQLGVAQADVVAFGDMPNDLPMLRWAGTSFAMTGAHPEVVAQADHLAPRCTDDGVAAVVERLLTGDATRSA